MRFLVLVTILALWMAWQTPPMLVAATYTYTPTDATTDLWSAGTDWSAVPVSNSGTALTFVGSNGMVLSNNLNNTSTDDIAGAFSLNILSLQGTGPAIGAATININSSSSDNYLNFVPSFAPVVNLNAMAGNGGLTYNVGANINLAADTTFQGNGTATFGFSGSIGGNSALIKSGTSMLTLAGANTYTGDTRCSGGILALGNTNALFNSTLDYSGYGGSLSFGTLRSVTLGGLNGSVSLSLTNNNSEALAMTVGNNNKSTSYSGALSGAGALTKIGTGTLTLRSANSYTGSTILSGGTLSFGNGALGTSGMIEFRGGALEWLNGNTQDISARIAPIASGQSAVLGSHNADPVCLASPLSGPGGVTVNGGTIVLAPANSYTGETTIMGGTLSFASGSLDSSCAIRFANIQGSMGSGFLQWASGNTQDISARIAPTTNWLEPVNLDTNGNNISFASALSGTSGVTKRGNGTLTFTTANTYTGGTTISGGAIQINHANSLEYSTVGISVDNGLCFRAKCRRFHARRSEREQGLSAGRRQRQRCRVAGWQQRLIPDHNLQRCAFRCGIADQDRHHYVDPREREFVFGWYDNQRRCACVCQWRSWKRRNQFSRGYASVDKRQYGGCLGPHCLD